MTDYIHSKLEWSTILNRLNKQNGYKHLFPSGKKGRTLKQKLQSMIDNYCEHPEIYSPAHPKCMKCGAFI